MNDESEKPPRRPGRWLIGAAAIAYVSGAILTQRWGVVRAMSPHDVARHALTPLAVALDRYANNNSGRLPNELADLVRQVYIDPWGLISPRSGNRPPGGASLLMQAENIAANPARHCSYVYLGQGVDRTLDPDAVALYEPGPSSGGETTLLFADGSIGWIDATAAEAFQRRVESPDRPVRWPPDGRERLLK